MSAEPSNLTFPDRFKWGGATSAQQVEGSLLEDGAGRSMWYGFARTPGHIVGGDLQDVACDHYRRYKEDVAIMRDLGLTGYQFSVSWARVLPEGTGRVNQTGLDFYDRLVDELLDAGISPMTVIYTWELPERLADLGAWTNRDCASWMAEYAAVLFDKIGDRVDHWLTMCEPMSVAHYGYVVGELAPGVRDLHAGLRATHNVLLGHGRTVEAFRASNAKGDIGIINGMADIRPASDDPADVAAAERVNAYYHALYLDPIVRGEYPSLLADRFAGGWPRYRDDDLKVISTPMDFIGIDYYNRSIVAGAEGDVSGGVAEEIGAAGPIGEGLARILDVSVLPPEGPFSDIGWELTPKGLYNVLRWLRDRYPGMPVHITEIGAAFDDEVAADGTVDDPRRLAYIRDCLVQAHRAIADGVDLRSCFIWSFTDTWEYNLGYGARFGLVHVDYETQRRTVKSSGRWFGQVAQAHGFSLDAAAGAS
jgi:beta-glucosidase